MLYFGRSPWMLQAVFALRQAVFVEEQHIPIDWEFDEKDQTCPYYLWLDGNAPIATIRYQFSTPNTLQPDRFCVAKAYRHQIIALSRNAWCPRGCPPISVIRRDRRVCVL